MRSGPGVLQIPSRIVDLTLWPLLLARPWTASWGESRVAEAHFGAALASAIVIGISVASTASGTPAEPALTLKVAKAKNITVKWSLAALPTRDGSAIEIERSVNGGTFSRVQKISRPKPSASWTDKLVPHGVLRYQARLLIDDEVRPYGAIAQITVGTVSPTTTTVAPQNPTGAYRWSAQPGGERWLDNVNATDVAVAPDGGVVATGQFQGTATFATGNRTAAGNNDIFVVKYSATGAALWAKTYGGAGIDKGAAIAVAPSGEIVVAGTFANTVDFGAGAVTSTGDTDGFFLVLSPGNGATLGNAVRLGGRATIPRSMWPCATARSRSAGRSATPRRSAARPFGASAASTRSSPSTRSRRGRRRGAFAWATVISTEAPGRRDRQHRQRSCSPRTAVLRPTRPVPS